MRTAVDTAVEILDSRISGGVRSCVGRRGIAVVFVAELSGTISRADREIHALAAPVRERERAVEVLGIGRIAVPEPVPAFPDPVQVGVMEIEERVPADR